jgi:hypothetical protein
LESLGHAHAPDAGWTMDGQPVLDPNASGETRNERNEPVSLIALS